MPTAKLAIDPGTKLHIKPVKRMEVDPDFELFSVLESVSNDGFLVFPTPYHLGAFYSFFPGDMVELRFFHPRKAGLFFLRCAIVERFIEAGLHFTKAKAISPIDVLQRRDDFRLEVSMTGEVTVRTVQNEQTETLTCACLCTDISAGGATLFLVDADLQVGDVFDVSLPIWPEGRLETVKAEVRRRIDGEKPMDQYRIGVKFIFDNRVQQQTMTRFVFDLQQEMLRNRHMR